MQCGQCRHDNPPGAKFCSECGERLAAVCAACGHANLPGSRFCNECGQVLAAQPATAPRPERAPPQSYTPRYLAEKILTSRHALEGERKQVTVLFADLKGSLELLADRDPEEARKLLDPVLEHMMEAVHRYEGTVNQVMGDGIMALFGAPVAHEDHAVRACYAALAMQEAIRRYTADVRRDHGIEIQIRVGLHSGEVVVRTIGSDLRMDYSAVGQTTHLAARMEQLATPGTTRMTGETLRLAEGFVQVTPLGPIPVKGVGTPVEVFELTGAAATRTRLQAAAARGLSRFVGRARELEHLQEALDKVRAGHGQIVAVVGEPGVGKSRLLWEFIHSHRTQDCLVLESSSVSYGRASAYLPVIDLCKSYFQIEVRDDGRRVREKVTGKLLTLDEALRGTLPAFFSLLEVPVEASWAALDPLQRRRRTVDALRRVVLRESQVQPVCVVFEDLHWIDAETQGLLDALGEGLPTARVLLLVNYRPEYQHGWGSKTYYSQLRLDPLPPESTEELLLALLGEDQALGPLTRLLMERTEGVPFFLEESVRTLVESGALAGERGAYRLARPFDTIQVPATVQAILAARIDRLPPEDKALLQTAAVIGKDVPFALLKAIAEIPEAALRDGLARLQAAEFLYETALFPELEYTFKHALTQEVAYGTLLGERRRALHAAIVRSFEALYPGRAGERKGWLMHHAFRGEVWDKAVAHLQSADSLPSLDGYTASLGPDNTGHLWWIGDHEHAIRMAQRDLGAAHALTGWGRFALTVTTNLRVAQAHHSLGDYSRAIAILKANVEELGGDMLHERCYMSGLPSVLSRAWLAMCHAELGDFGDAIAIGEEAIQIAEAGDPRYSLIVACAGLGNVCLIKGDFERAVPVLERGLPRETDEVVNRAWSLAASALGAAYTGVGRTEEALPLLEEAVTRAVSMKLMANHSLRLARLAEAHLVAGRPENAFPVAAQALDLARDHRERGHEAQVLRVLGDISARREPADLDRADDCYRKALALTEQLAMRPLQAQCHLGLSRLHQRRGKDEAARHAASSARALANAMGMTVWLQRAEAARASE